MAGNKTIDGLRIEQIARMMLNIPGIEIRKGTNHPFVAIKSGLRPCPIATSTNAKKMIVPWLAQATGYNRNCIYDSLRLGEWQYSGG